MLAVLGVARSQLCRRYLPLPVARVVGLLRASDAIAIIVGITVLVDWIGLALRADQDIWGVRTAFLVSVLALITGLLAISMWRSRRVVRELRRHFGGRAEDGDWITDLLPLVIILSEKFPRVGRPLVRLTEWIDAHALNGSFGIRRKPLAYLACGSIGAALAIIGAQAFREEGFSWIFPLDVTVAAGGFFAFAVIANRSLHLVKVRPTDGPIGQAAWVAATLAALALPVSLALRDLIWRGLGLGTHVSSLPQLTAVLATSFLVVLVLSFVGAILVTGDTASGAPSA